MEVPVILFLEILVMAFKRMNIKTTALQPVITFLQKHAFSTPAKNPATKIIIPMIKEP